MELTCATATSNAPSRSTNKYPAGRISVPGSREDHSGPMIRHHEHAMIDKKKWDACIDTAHGGLVYGYSWYLDVVSPGWEALISGDYNAVMPLTARSKFGFHYLFRPYFAQQLGVFSAESSLDCSPFIEKIPSRFKLAEISLNQWNNFDGNRGEVSSNSNYELNLDNKYSSLVSGYSKNTRRNIAKALKHKLHARAEGMDLDDLVLLFRSDRGAALSNLGSEYYDLLARIEQVCRQRNRTVAYGVFTEEEKLIAGALFLVSKGRDIFLFSGNSKTGKSTGAMHLLIDTYIKDHSEMGKLLDFEGSNDPDMARFYRGFGSEERSYLRVKWNDLPRIVKWLKR